MGHYLSEMESDDEHYARVVLGPLAEKVRTYDEECRRGLVHTEEYTLEIMEARTKLAAHGWNVTR